MSSSKPLRALVVEDQELFRQAVADELGFFGFEVETAIDGEQGLRAALSSSFDLVLSDMRMPNRDGRWLLTELRKTMKCAPPFVFMTGFTDLTPQDAYEMGADGFLGKPLNPDRLGTLISKVCRPVETRWSDRPSGTPDHRIAKAFASWGSEATRAQFALGRGGMFLALESVRMKQGDLAAFDVQFADGPLKRLEGLGTVVWKRDVSDVVSEYGVDFEFISSAALPGWLTYLASKELIPVIPNGRLKDREDKTLTVAV